MALSGYRVMWMMVMFDLPVLTTEQRREATRFREYLLDQGFEMSQLSIYMRFCAGKEQVEAMNRKIAANLPSTGKVHIVSLTDRQYQNIVCFDGRTQGATKKREQYVLF